MASRVVPVDVVIALKSMFFSSLVEHPSKWFEKNPGKKPPVELPANIYYYGTSTWHGMHEVRSTIKYFLLHEPSRRLSPDLALLYFRLLTYEMQAQLDTDWTSFGITIGKAGRTVGPLSIVDVKDRAPVKLELNQTVAAGPKDDLWILMALASAFYHFVSAGGNGKTFRPPPEVSERWKKVGFKPELFLGGNYTLTNSSSYRIMIAVFDMFLVRFPNHKFNPARKLTSVSRFQGCAAYKSLCSLYKLINKSFREIQTWLWSSQLQNELLRITAPGHEMNQVYSYAPYFMVLRLAHISAYSEKEHPNLYAFCNIVRATLNDQEARCARMPIEAISPDVPINASLFAYTMLPGNERLEGLPDKNDIEGWFEWFLKYRSSCEQFHTTASPPKELIQKLYRTWSTFGQDPPGSIGKMLSNVDAS